jgi:hypothetical protein
MNVTIPSLKEIEMEIFKKSKNGPQAQVPAIPHEGSARPYVAPRAARTWSEAALQSAQHVDDLEATIHTLQDKLQNAEIRNQLVEEANMILKEDHAREKAEWQVERTQLKLDRDQYHAQFMAQNTSLEISGKVILDALDAAKAAIGKMPKAAEPNMGELEDRILDEYRPKAHKKFEGE